MAGRDGEGGCGTKREGVARLAAWLRGRKEVCVERVIGLLLG